MSEKLEEQYNKIYRYCYMKLGHRETAEDLTQETFLRFFRDYRYQDIGKEMAYLYMIARNQCIDYYRKKKPLVLSDFLLLSMLANVPEEYRVLAQLWDSIPVNFISIGGAFENYLYPFFGTYLTAWQVIPWVYLLLAVVAGGLCFQRYQSFQAGGR